MNPKRIVAIMILFIFLSVIVIGKLLWVQVVNGEEMTKMSAKQKVRVANIGRTYRGQILDCNGIAINGTKEVLSVMVFPSAIKNVDEVVTQISTLLDIDSDILYNKIRGYNKAGEEIRREAFFLNFSLNNDQIDYIKRLDLDGVFVLPYVLPYQDDMPALHIMGLLTKANAQDIKNNQSYSEGMLVGRSGLEYQYDSDLQGTGAERIGVIVNGKNEIIKDTGYIVFDNSQCREGDSINTTIDIEIQRALEGAFGDKVGAGIVMDSNTGNILAMVSTPKYDPYYMKNDNEVMVTNGFVNKTIKSVPPASLFKIFTASIAIEKGVTNVGKPYICNGYYQLDDKHRIGCWKKEGHGLLLFEQSIALSCNPVFIDVGLKLGGDVIKSSFKEWGLDDDTIIGYDVANQSKLDFNSSVLADIANVSIGEKGVSMTPVNIAKMVNVIANGGIVVTPRLVTGCVDTNGNLVWEKPIDTGKRVISSGTAETVKSMMTRTFIDGTGKSLKLSGLSLAGKTGTSETGNVWLSGFFPSDNPRYTIVILVEDAKSGLVDAGPIFKQIVSYLSAMDKSKTEQS